MAYKKAYIKWYLSHNKRLYLTYLLIVATILFTATLLFPYDAKESSMPPLIWTCFAVFGINIIMAMITPVYQFRYLMNKRSVDLYYPLPMEKASLFRLNYGIGIAYVCIPNLLFFLVFLSVGEAYAYFWIYLIYMAELALMSLATYAMVTFFVLKCNSLWDACFAAVAVVLVQILLVTSLLALLEDVIYEVLRGGGSVREFFPVSLIEGFSTVIPGFEWLVDVTDAFHNWQLFGGNLVEECLSQSSLYVYLPIYYLFIIVLFTISARSAYVKRKGEDSEQKTTSRLIFPLFISLITGTLLFYGSRSFSSFCFIVVLFFLMNSLAERKITIRLKMLVYLCIYGVALYLVSLLLIETSGFGRIHEFYEPNDITAVRVELHLYQEDTFDEVDTLNQTHIAMNDFQSDQELIQHVVALHHKLVEQPISEDGSEIGDAFSVEYVLNNGSTVYRYIGFNQKDEALTKQLIQYLKAQGYSNEEQSYEEW